MTTGEILCGIALIAMLIILIVALIWGAVFCFKEKAPLLGVVLIACAFIFGITTIACICDMEDGIPMHHNVEIINISDIQEA